MPQDYSAFFPPEEDDPATQTAGTNVRALEAVDPKRAAAVRKAAMAAGVPVLALEPNHKAVLAGEHYNASDAALARSPTTARWLAHPDNAAIAHDQAPNLADIDATAKRATQSPLARTRVPAPDPDVGGFSFLRDPQALHRLRGVQDYFGGVAEAALNRTSQGVWGLLSLGADFVGGGLPNPVSAFTAQMGATYARQAEAATPKTGIRLADEATAGLVQVPANLAGTAASIVTRNPMVGVTIAGGQAAGQTYQQGQAEGISPTNNARNAVTQGLVESLMEKLPATKLIEDIFGGSGLLRTIRHQLATEIPTEAATTILQNMSDWVFAHPDKSVGDFLREQPDALLSTVIQTAVMTSVTAGGAHVVTTAADAQVRAAQEKRRHEAIDAVATAIKASPVMQRSPEAMADFLGSSAHGEDIFIPAQTVQTYLQSLPTDKAQEFVERTGIGPQLANEAQAGTDIVIPAGTYLAEVAPTEHHAAMANDLRVGIDGMSLAEVEEFQKTAPDQLAKAGEGLASEAAAADERAAPAQKVYDESLAMFRAAGYGVEAAQAQATLWAARYQTRAERSPGLYKDAYDAFAKAGTGQGVTVQRGEAGGEGGGRVLSQTEKGLLATQAQAQAYRESAGLGKTAFVGTARPDPEVMKAIADEFDAAPEIADDEATKTAYNAMIAETAAQYRSLGDIKVEAWEQAGEPYKSSADMIADVRDNKHLWFYLTEAGFGHDVGEASHPLLGQSEFAMEGGRRLLHNDVFRIVHDYFAHTQGAYNFGPVGELNAFLEHETMYSDTAAPAVAAETLMQNAWVNFGPHMRRPDGSIPVRGDPDYVPIPQRRFADQKVFAASAQTLAAARALRDLATDDRRYYQSGNPFYSALTQTVRDSKTKAASADQWWATISKTPGVKKEELEWTGLQDWLRLQAEVKKANGEKDSIAQEEVLQYTIAKGVQVEEVVQNQEGLTESEAFYDAVEEYVQQGFNNNYSAPDYDVVELTAEEAGNLGGRTPGTAGWYVVSEFSRHHGWAGDWIAGPFAADGDNTAEHEAKMEKQSLEQTHRDEAYDLYEEENQEWAYEQAVEEFSDKGVPWAHYTMPGAQNVTNLVFTLPQIAHPPQTHWNGIPGVFAHARMSDRDTPDGERVLFVEEIQSDWHQDAAKAAKRERMDAEQNLADVAGKLGIRGGVYDTILPSAEHQAERRKEVVADLLEKMNKALAEGWQTSPGRTALPSEEGAAKIQAALDRLDAAKKWKGYTKPASAEQRETARAAMDKAQADMMEAGEPLMPRAIEALETNLPRLRAIAGVAHDLEVEASGKAAAASRAAMEARNEDVAAGRPSAQPGTESWYRHSDAVTAHAVADHAERKWRDANRDVDTAEKTLAMLRTAPGPGAPVSLRNEVIGRAQGVLASSYLIGELTPDAQAALTAYQDATLRAAEAAKDVRNAEGTGGIADAPFKDAWSALVMKRIIRWAVDHDYETVAWTTGPQIGPIVGQDPAKLDWFYRRNAKGEPGVLVNQTNNILKPYGIRVGEIDMRPALAQRVERDWQATLDTFGETRDPDTIRAEAHSMMEAEPDISTLPDGANVGTGPMRFSARLLELQDELDAARRARELRGHIVESREGTSERLAVQPGFTITPELKEAAGAGFALFQDARGSVTFSPEGAVIRLFQGRDLSTLLHEGGHVWLEELELDAAEAGASDQVKTDYQTARDWLGLGKGDHVQVEHHEQWARGVEQYLREGVAPSEGLSGAFKRFSRWLMRLYRRASDLNVEISPQMREVFGRLIATDAELANTRQGQSLNPLFASAKDAGMSEAEFAAYQKAIDGADSSARAKLLAKTMETLRRERTKAWRDEWSREYEDALVEVDQTGPMRAREFIRINEQPLDRGEINSMMGEDYHRRLPDRLVAREGIHPDAIAEAVGEESGRDLLRSLAAQEASRVTRQAQGDRRSPRQYMAASMADARMKERHGDPLNDGSLEAEAEAAVNNAMASRVIGAEITALARQEGQPDGRWRMAALVEWSRKVIGEKPIGRLRPGAYLKAERDAGKAAQEALLGRKIGEALEAKWKQLANMILYREAKAAADRVEEVTALFDKINAANDEKTAKTRDINMVNAARAIIAPYGFDEAKRDPGEYLELLKKYDPETAATLEPLVAQAVAGAKPLKELTFDEVDRLGAFVEQLWKLSRSAKTITIEGRKVEIGEAAERLMDDLRNHDAKYGDRGVTQAVTDKEKRSRGILGWRGALTKVEEWAARFGPNFTRLIWRPVAQAADRYRADRERYLPKLLASLREVNRGLGRGKIKSDELGYTFGANRNNGMAELLGAMRHMGNKSNLRKLLLGRSWGEEDENGELITKRWDTMITRLIREGVLEQRHFDYLQAEWNLHEEIKPLAQAAHQALYGRYFEEVTADPFDTPWGQYAGGYVPATGDREMNEDVNHREDEATIMNGTSGSFMFPTPANGFTKSRVDYNVPLALDLRLAIHQMDQVLRFAHLGPVIRDVNRLLKHKDFAAELNRHDPVAWADLLLPWLKRAASGRVTTPTSGDAGRLLDNVARFVGRSTGANIMFASLLNTAQQITGFGPAMLRTGKWNMAVALGDYMRDPGAVTKAMIAASPLMANRNKEQMVELIDAADEIVLKPNLYEKAVTWTARHTYFMQHALQNVMDPIIWTAARSHAVAIGEDDPEAYADMVIRTTQGSSNPEDVTRWASGPTWARPFKMFSNYFLEQGNMLDTEWRKAGSLGRRAEIYALGFLVPSVVAKLISEALSGRLDGDDEDGWLDDLFDIFVLSQIQYALAFVPIAGQAVNLALNRFDDKPYNDKLALSPIASTVESAGAVPFDVARFFTEDGGDVSKTINDVGTLAAIGTGLPTRLVTRPVAYAADVAEGDVTPTSGLDYARGLATGTASPASRE